ncbi:MAG: DPP IV N-terminal domain-containing protein [Planctomycetota bacterium]|nr:DPP IV N-terminal domain-containing protein [Planctomycetota bacterium]
MSRWIFVVMGLCCWIPQKPAVAQKLKSAPGYGRYVKANQARFQVSRGGRIQKIQWSKDFTKFSFKGSMGTRFFSLEEKRFIPEVEFERYQPPKTAVQASRTLVPRAEQRQVEPSVTGQWTAIYKNYNVTLRKKATAEEVQVTLDGNEKLRYGTCCWVYGEELDQQSAMWWSPDDKYLAFYEVSESHMRDYHLTLDNTKNYTRLQTVRYPKAGDPNPKVSILVYELATQKTVRVFIKGEDTQYLYNIRWTPGGKELLINRTNRHQNVLDVFAVNPATGNSRLVVTEKQDTWQNNSPEMRFLADQSRFIWETEKNGWKNYELRDLSGKLITELTRARGFPVHRIVLLDEKAGWLYYSAFSAGNPYNQQLHRVRLDGSQNSKITTSPLNHTSTTISPDHRWLIATCEDLKTPPATVLYSMSGQEIARLDVGKINEKLKLHLTAELFHFVAADGKTKIYGTLHKPSNFDPSKKYPLLIDVYGGPNSRGLRNQFRPVNPYCEFGFCIAKIANRGTVERGKKFESANYLQLGGPDLQDQVDGVRELAKRDYIDGSRVGIYGHSYGGYLSALAILKFPKQFHVAVAGAPVSKWENYDTIYTERYMKTPQENKTGYQSGSCMQYASQLEGKLLLVHGLIDDNVHPANTWQLVEALHRADKRFDMQIYPNFKHGIGSTYFNLRWEYLIRHLKPSSN